MNIMPLALSLMTAGLVVLMAIPVAGPALFSAL